MRTRNVTIAIFLFTRISVVMQQLSQRWKVSFESQIITMLLHSDGLIYASAVNGLSRSMDQANGAIGWEINAGAPIGKAALAINAIIFFMAGNSFFTTPSFTTTHFTSAVLTISPCSR